MLRYFFAFCMMGLLCGVPALGQTTDVSFGGARLQGTLVMPTSAGKAPAVLLIAGSGPVDRDDNMVSGPVRPNTLKLIADGLASAGIASLRYDKRAVTLTKLPRSEAQAAEQKLSFDDFVKDAVSGADYLAARPDVSCVFILGHSQGALVGALAAAKVKPCGYISAEGAGLPIDAVLLKQLTAAGLSEQQVHAVLDPIRHGNVVADVPPGLLQVFRPSVQPFLMSWMKYDPAKAVAAVPAPVLILQGSTDFQVSEADANRLTSDRPDATLVLLTGVNHILKTAPAERQANVATYVNPDLPLDPAVMPAIIKFIRSHS